MRLFITPMLWQVRDTLPRSLSQGLVNVFLDVLHVFQTYGEPDEIFRDTRLLLLLPAQLLMDRLRIDGSRFCSCLLDLPTSVWQSHLHYPEQIKLLISKTRAIPTNTMSNLRTRMKFPVIRGSSVVHGLPKAHQLISSF